MVWRPPSNPSGSMLSLDDVKARVTAATQTPTPPADEPEASAGPGAGAAVEAGDAAPAKGKKGEKKAAPPAAPDADDAPAAGAQKYRVSLKYNAPHVVEAEDRLDAIEKYNAWCGIIHTPHKHKVEKV